MVPGVETQYSRKVLESIKVILMRTPSKRGYIVSTDHLLQPGKTFNGGTRLYSSELLTKDDRWKTTNPRQTLRQEVALHKLTAGTYCHRKHAHMSLNMGKSNWCTHEALTPMCSSLLCRKALCSLPNRNVDTISATKHFTYILTCLKKYAREMVSQNMREWPTNV